MVWMESLSPAKDFRFFGQAMWAEGNDLLAFQNIPTAEFEASALALIGESLARCFRAQWRCYHIISGLNGLPTVCLKGSRNDRDQLITAPATRRREPSDLLTDEQTPSHAYADISSYSGSLQHTQVEEWHWGFLDLDLCIKQKEKLTMRTCANTVGPPLPIPLLSLPTSLQNRYFQRTLVPRQSTATGGALAGQHSVHIETKGRCHPGYLSYNNYAKKLWSCASMTHTHKDTRWNFHSATPFMWKVFSQPGLQTSLTTMSRTVKSTPEEGEGEEKQGLGNVQTEALCLPH